MARYEHLPLYKKAMDTAVSVENIVKGFSRYHKYTLGTDLRNQSRESVSFVIRANSQTDTSSLSWVTITSGSSATGNGTVVILVSANTTGATRTGNITIAGQTFTITQSGAAQNNCAASVSSSLVVHIPIVTYSSANYWADLQYSSSTGQLTVANAGIVSDASSYSSCTASTLSSDFKLHIPVVMISDVSYWADLEWKGDAFVIAGVGPN